MINFKRLRTRTERLLAKMSIIRKYNKPLFLDIAASLGRDEYNEMKRIGLFAENKEE